MATPARGPARWLKGWLLRTWRGRLLSDRTFIRWQYERRLGGKLDLDAPATFQEKVQWLKLQALGPAGRVIADKLAVRGYVEQRCGPGLLNELYRVYDRVEDIDLRTLPTTFVLRPTHSSGSNVICHDKAALDWAAASARLRRDLARDYFWVSREPGYRGLPRRILCERFLGRPGETLPDYKIFCFDGVPRLVQVDVDRHRDHRRALFDLDWHLLPFKVTHELPDQPVPRPACLDEMLAHAARLSQGFALLRVDLYDADGKVVFGELTAYPEAGLGVYMPPSADRELGTYLHLPVPGGAAGAGDGRVPIG
jgi:hypothetical protein